MKKGKKNSNRKTTKRRNKKARWSLKKKFLVSITVLLTSFLVAVGVALGIIYHYINKVDIVKDNNNVDIVDSIPEDDDLTLDPESPQEDLDELENSIKDNLNNQNTDIISDENVFNVLLIGTDGRSKNERGRSDSMILVSINKSTKEIIMTSFMRDIYLSIPDVESTKLNHAYAYGGAPLLVKTIQQNFKIKIDRYVQVNFFSFIEVVDSVGGIEINVTNPEVKHLNNYLAEINRLKGISASNSKLSSGGTYTLNGRQALSYARIRYVGDGDFERTERQRKVLMKVLEKLKSSNVKQLDNFLNTLLPQVTTNCTKTELVELVLNSAAYFNYDIKQNRVPYDNTWKFLTIRKMSVLSIDFDKNIKYIHDNIYK